MTTYVAMAYRWGWLNCHHYLVAVGTDLSCVTQRAQAECDNRGGKYGVEVLGVPAEGSASPLTPENVKTFRAAYFPSLHGESAPFDNPRIRIFQRLGQQVFHAVEGGRVLLPSPDEETPGGSRILKPQEVSVPDWVRAEKTRIEEFEMALHQWALKDPEHPTQPRYPGEPT